MEQSEEETVKNRRKQSESENDFFFEVDRSDRAVEALQQRIEELEFEMKIKDEALAAISVFVNQNMADLNIESKGQIVDLLNR